MKEPKELTYSIKEDGINEVIDEGGNMILMLREVGWNGRDHRLELRKWIIDAESEKPMKGCTFMTEQGPHNAEETFVRLGFGQTTNLLHELSAREDFEQSLVHTIGQKKVDEAKQQVVLEDEDYFIPSRENLGF